jgi:hypothetical protein
MKDKELKQAVLTIEQGLNSIYAGFNLGEPSKKIRKVVSRAAKRIGKEIKQHLKQEAKKRLKAVNKLRKSKKGTTKKRVNKP